MNTSIEKRIAYERLGNGVDVHLLKTSTKDVILASIAFPLGASGAHTEKRMTLSLAEGMFPLGAKKIHKEAVEDIFEGLGAHVDLEIGKEYAVVSLATCKQVFPQAFSLLMEVLLAPRLTSKDFLVAKDRLANKVRHTKENTRVQATVALGQSLFKQGHPHWPMNTTASLAELESVTKEDVLRVYGIWPKSVGTIVTVTGDVEEKKVMQHMRAELGALQEERFDDSKRFDSTLQVARHALFSVVTMEGKKNVDTVFGIPLTLTLDDTFFLPLSVGVHILGGSSTSRLFNSLRTKQSLTYGAYAGLAGFSKLYPGMLSGMAIFPHTVFLQGRKSLRAEIELFIEKGITSRELSEYKKEEQGSFTIGLSTTVGMHRALFTMLVQGRPMSYLDTYLMETERVKVRDVRNAMQVHLDVRRLAIVGAGAVDLEGRPL